MNLLHVCSSAAMALATVALSAQCQIDPNVGVNLALADEAVSPVQRLGFRFAFAGQTYDSVYVASNGFLYLFDTAGSLAPPAGARCCNPDVAGLLAASHPMVCGMWTDLDPGAAGAVHFNALANKALITWLGVPEFGSNTTNTFQIVLNADGAIDMVFAAGCSANSHSALTGWCPGNAAPDPGSTNLSNLPIAPARATVYEIFSPGTFDLVAGLRAVPNGGNAWIVTGTPGCARVHVVGRGCPRPCTVFEEFASNGFDLSNSGILFTATGGGAYSAALCANCFDTGFANAITLGDDALAVGMNLGFTFPYCNGSTSSIDVCSNGFVWLVSGASSSADWTPTAGEFLSAPARLAAAWMDLDPTAGGTVYFDALRGRAMVTWNNVPAFGAPGPNNTFQLQLFANGNFLVSWGNVLNNAATGGAALVGFTPGNGAASSGSFDLSAGLPFSTSSGTPAILAPQGASSPYIGSTFTVEARNVRATTAGGVLIIGTANPNFDLTQFGATGCSLLASLDVVLDIATTAPVTTLALAIPNSPLLIGGLIQLQVALVDPTLGTPIPVHLTNGLAVRMGL